MTDKYEEIRRAYGIKKGRSQVCNFSNFMWQTFYWVFAGRYNRVMRYEVNATIKRLWLHRRCSRVVAPYIFRCIADVSETLSLYSSWRQTEWHYVDGDCILLSIRTYYLRTCIFNMGIVSISETSAVQPTSTLCIHAQRGFLFSLNCRESLNLFCTVVRTKH
jgi:hypothetical protein